MKKSIVPISVIIPWKFCDMLFFLCCWWQVRPPVWYLAKFRRDDILDPTSRRPLQKLKEILPAYSNAPTCVRYGIKSWQYYPKQCQESDLLDYGDLDLVAAGSLPARRHERTQSFSRHFVPLMMMTWFVQNILCLSVFYLKTLNSRHPLKLLYPIVDW